MARKGNTADELKEAEAKVAALKKKLAAEKKAKAEIIGMAILKGTQDLADCPEAIMTLLAENVSKAADRDALGLKKKNDRTSSPDDQTASAHTASTAA